MRRLLLISYYFPPSGGPGVQRTLKFAKYLREFGWDPTVLSVNPEHAAYPSIDESLAEEVPAGIRVVRTRSWDPYGAYATLTGRKKSDAVSVSFSGEGRPNLRQRAGRWFRGNVFLPDARVGWVPFALPAAKRLLRDGSYDALMTTGPPHSTHLIGLLLRGDARIPWLVDLRDPWTTIDFSHLLPTSAMARRVDSAMEKRVLSSADRVAIVSPFLADHLQSRHVRVYDVIMNGFDSTDFERTTDVGEGEFTVSYMGSMDTSRNPEALWRALSEPDMRQLPLRVRLIGNVDPTVLDSVVSRGLDDRVEVVGQVDHAESTRLMCSSSLLLLVINRTPLANGIVPGKGFEYIGSGRPVLAIGPTAGDAAAVMRDTGAGQMFDYDDAEGVQRFLMEHVTAWMNGAPLGGASPERAEAYSRQNRTRQLAQLLDELCSGEGR